jgi:hypothetical protein
LNKLELDVSLFESEASFYLSHVMSGSPAALISSSKTAILPILEAIRNNQVHEIFAQALNKKCLCVAALCCAPPNSGQSLTNPDPTELIQHYDAKATGKAFRAICIAISRREYPLIVAEQLSQSLCRKGLPELNSLVKNGLYELGRGVAMAPFREGKHSIDRVFLQNLHVYSGAKQSGEFSNLLGESQYFAFKAFIEEGNSFNVVDFLDYANGLAGNDTSLKQAVVDNYLTAFRKVFENPRATEMASLINLLLTTNHPALDDYRLAVIKSVDTMMGLDDFLKASIKLQSMQKKSSENVTQEIATVYIEAGAAVLTAGIKDRDDYTYLSNLPGFDIYSIDIKKIPKQARGAALEHGLGL